MPLSRSPAVGSGAAPGVVVADAEPLLAAGRRYAVAADEAAAAAALLTVDPVDPACFASPAYGAALGAVLARLTGSARAAAGADAAWLDDRVVRTRHAARLADDLDRLTRAAAG